MRPEAVFEQIGLIDRGSLGGNTAIWSRQLSDVHNLPYFECQLGFQRQFQPPETCWLNEISQLFIYRAELPSQKMF